MLLTTLDRVKTFLEIPTSETSRDALLTQLIENVSSRFTSYLNRLIEVKERTEDLTVDSISVTFFVKGAPIHSITSIESDYNRDFAGADLLSTGDYTSYNDIGQIVIDQAYIVPGYKSLRIKYVSGFAFDSDYYIARQAAPPSAPSTGDKYLTTGAPTGAWVGQANKIATWNGSSWDFEEQSASFITNHLDIAGACDSQVAFEFQNRNRKGVTYNMVASAATTFSLSAFLPEVKHILDLHRRSLAVQE